MDPTRPVATTLAHTAGTVGTSSDTLVAANTSRRALTIQNVHETAIVYIRLDGGTVTALTGNKIAPGQMFNMRELGVVTHSAITAISDTADTPVVVVEG